ncbi:MAG: hypothetical protein OEZ19_00880 [Paracoccaceae bacterium]|nr:hypothetical protein [Paracoccaceae bacterium]
MMKLTLSAVAVSMAYATGAYAGGYGPPAPDPTVGASACYKVTIPNTGGTATMWNSGECSRTGGGGDGRSYGRLTCDLIGGECDFAGWPVPPEDEPSDEDGDHDNGHGNDEDGVDEDNPGQND